MGSSQAASRRRQALLRRQQGRPTTSKQADYLISLGVDRDSVPWDRAAASELISRLQAEREGQGSLLLD